MESSCAIESPTDCVWWHRYDYSNSAYVVSGTPHVPMLVLFALDPEHSALPVWHCPNMPTFLLGSRVPCKLLSSLNLTLSSLMIPNGQGVCSCCRTYFPFDNRWRLRAHPPRTRWRKLSRCARRTVRVSGAGSNDRSEDRSEDRNTTQNGRVQPFLIAAGEKNQWIIPTQLAH